MLKPVRTNVDRVLSEYRISSRVQKPGYVRPGEASLKEREARAVQEPAVQSSRPRHTEEPIPAKPSPINEEKLSRLDDSIVAVYRAMPQGRAVSVDEVCASGLPAGQVMTALTLLEMNKLVSSLPGGRYMRV